MDIDDWAEDLLKDVCEKWETIGYKYDFSECGFRVFYSPISVGPDLMLIGYNPGKEDKPFCKEDDSMIPDFHEYLYHNSRTARKMKYLFESVERYDWLEESVKLNLIFFRSENEAQWEAMNKDLRGELEMFCFNRVNDIIDTLKPRYIITEGLKVFDLLTNTVLMGCDKPKVEIGVGGRKIYSRSRYGYSQIIGMPHLTNDRISYPDWNNIKEYLKADLKDLQQTYLH
jgi:hypothetical protein